MHLMTRFQKYGISTFFAWASIGHLQGQYVMVIIGLATFLYVIGSRVMRYSTIVRDRMLTVVILLSL